MDLAGVTCKDHATLSSDRMSRKLTDCYMLWLRAVQFVLTDGIRLLDKSSISLPLHGSNRPQHYDKRVLHLVVASPMDCRTMTEGSYIYVVSLVIL